MVRSRSSMARPGVLGSRGGQGGDSRPALKGGRGGWGRGELLGKERQSATVVGAVRG